MRTPPKPDAPTGSPNPPTGNSDEVCGHLFLDNRYLGFFWTCSSAEKLLEKLTGYPVKIPRSASGARPPSSGVLRLEVLASLTRLSETGHQASAHRDNEGTCPHTLASKFKLSRLGASSRKGSGTFRKYG